MLASVEQSDFWDPQFNVTTRPDGAIIIEQKDPLPDHMPVLADYLDRWADATPEQPWIARRVDGGDWRRITYGQARDSARRIGAALLGLGLGPDRPLLILSGNSLEHALLGVACLYVGIPYAPVSPAYSLVSKDHAKLKDIAALLQPGAVFADDGDAFAPAIAAIATEGMQTISLTGAGDLAFEALMQGDPAASDAARAALTSETVVKYLFTSGSTGSPKAVINTNAMICANQAMVRDCYRFVQKRPPVVLDWAPWNHTAAGNKVSYMVLTNGGTYYIDDGKPAPGKIDETLRNLREVPCTWYFNVPVGWDLLVEALEQDAALAQTFFSQLVMMFYAGAGMAQHTWDRLRAVARKTTGHEVLLAGSLGATETAPFALAWTEHEETSGNVGVPSAGMSMKLVPSGDKLELRLKGPTMTPGYYGDPEKTAEAFDDEGYYCMGDAVRPADPADVSRGFFFDGRVAENFKLNTGTWVSVGPVRGALVDAMDGLVRDAVIVGENEAELQARLSAAAKRATGSASRVRRARVLDAEPSFDKGEVTEKGSLNQRAMRSHHAEAVAALYRGEGALIA
jgi:feruloyl-CoA synthase